MQQYVDVFYTTLDALCLYAREYPGPHAGAPTLLCLHDLTRNSKDFDALATHLCLRYRVICPDLRGHGRSQYDTDRDNYRAAVYVSDIWRLLDVLRIDRVSVIGTSMGALLAMHMNATAPQRVVRVVLNDAGPEVDSRGVSRIAAWADTQKTRVSSWEDAVAHVSSQYANAYPDFSPEDWIAYARANFILQVDGLRVDYDLEILSGPSALAKLYLWPAFLALGDKPILVLRGELSDVLPAETAMKMWQRLPNVTTATVPNRGHSPTLEEPIARAAIDTFLATTDASR